MEYETKVVLKFWSLYEDSGRLILWPWSQESYQYSSKAFAFAFHYYI